MPNEILVIDGKISNIRYISKWKSKLPTLTLEKAQGSRPKKNVFFYTDSDEQICISVWTSPKRTKTNPLPRVFSTLGHEGIKITIIPVLKEEGESGEQNLLHANTIYWMSSLGVYVIIGYYKEAILGKVGRQASNAKEGKPSKEGNPKFAEQILDLDMIRRQIHQIIEKTPNIHVWNDRQINHIPLLLEKSIRQYKKLGMSLGVPLKVKSLEKKEFKNNEWKKNIQKMFEDNSNDEILAQTRETKTDHKHEDIPEDYGGKGKFNIECGKSKMLYLTADAVSVDKQEKIITITEAKNTIKDKFPNADNIRDDLMKLMMFRKSNFTINGEEYQKKIRCCLKGMGTIDDFRNNFSELIQECKLNEIELRFNDTIME